MKFIEQRSSARSIKNRMVEEGSSRLSNGRWFDLKRRLSIQEAAAIEPAIRKVVREELERHVRFCVPSSLKPPHCLMEIPSSTKWQLVFTRKLSNTLYTSKKIESESNKPLQIVIKDANSNDKTKTSPWSSVTIEIVVLSGEFDNDGEGNWLAEEFDKYVMRERKGKRPLVEGDRFVTLVDGVGYLGNLFFTDNSSWVRCRKFKLGARAVRKSSDGENIREAISGAFTVKDHHEKAYQKCYPPSLSDPIWRLEKIRKDGKFHNHLAAEGIQTVQDFLRLFTTDPLSLREKFSDGISEKRWHTIVGHAAECILDNKMYSYSQIQAGQKIELLFDSIFAVVGAFFDGGNFVPKEEFSTSNMNMVEDLKRQAYQHQSDIVEIDDVKADLLRESRSTSLENYLKKRTCRDLKDKADTDVPPSEASLRPESVEDLPSKSKVTEFSEDLSETS